MTSLSKWQNCNILYVYSILLFVHSKESTVYPPLAFTNLYLDHTWKLIGAYLSLRSMFYPTACKQCLFYNLISRIKAISPYLSTNHSTPDRMPDCGSGSCAAPFEDLGGTCVTWDIHSREGLRGGRSSEIGGSILGSVGQRLSTSRTSTTT